MHKLFFLLFLFILGVNGMILWQSHKKASSTMVINPQLTCCLKPGKNAAKAVMITGSVVLFN